jgi:hypothetical protein
LAGDPFREGDKLYVRFQTGEWRGILDRGGDEVSVLRSSSLLVIYLQACQMARDGNT